MTTYHFHKMHGLGNDFILIDARQQAFDLPAPQLSSLADRHTGIGCDQWLIIEPPRTHEACASYRIFNADGSSAEQCLNGLRCIGLYLSRTQQQSTLVVDGPTGLARLMVGDDHQVGVELPPPEFGAGLTGWRQRDTGGAEIIELNVLGKTFKGSAVSMGNPHLVIFTDDCDAARRQYGLAVSKHPGFSKGVNAGFARISGNQLHLAVYERGSGPTKACGSGACAAAAAAIRHHQLSSPVTVRQPGGPIVVDWAGAGQPLTLTGPACYVFTGEFDL
ncbi:MAG: diaminopimelate epimerase [Wenzhouxiangellaceae bacterium]